MLFKYTKLKDLVIHFKIQMKSYKTVRRAHLLERGYEDPQIISVHRTSTTTKPIISVAMITDKKRILLSDFFKQNPTENRCSGGYNNRIFVC